VPQNCSCALPPGETLAGAFSPPEGSGAPVLVEPSGALTLRQKVLPLNRQLGRFGEAVPQGQDTFTLVDVRLGGVTATAAPVLDNFAPGQFEQLSDADRLTLPSFEPMQAGFQVGLGALDFGPAVEGD